MINLPRQIVRFMRILATFRDFLKKDRFFEL